MMIFTLGILFGIFLVCLIIGCGYLEYRRNKVNGIRSKVDGEH